MNQESDIKNSLFNLKETFNRGGNNSDITKHEVRKTINKITKNKDYSNVKITDRRIED